jgi:hypothetical protein
MNPIKMTDLLPKISKKFPKIIHPTEKPNKEIVIVFLDDETGAEKYAAIAGSDGACKSNVIPETKLSKGTKIVNITRYFFSGI